MGRRGRPPHPDILTPREWEVLALLREGLTNEAISARLGVTHAAAKFHVSEILSKLGVGSREEAAAWRPGAAREPQLRRWWGVVGGWLRPVTVGKAALITAAVGVLAGLGVLAWGVLRDAGDETTPVVAASPTPTPAATTPAMTPWFLTAAPAPPMTPSAEWEARKQLVDGYSVYIVRKDGSDARRLAGGYDPEWSPDGQRIAYVGASTGGGLGGIDWIHVSGIGGGAPKEIGAYTWGDFGGCGPPGPGRWSPDSTRFAIRIGQGGTPYQAAIVNVDTGDRDEWNACYAEWLPDGRIVFAGRCEEPAENGCTLIRDGPSVTELLVGDRARPSPDGGRLAFWRGDGLWITDLDGGRETLVAKATPQGIDQPDWSPGGDSIVFSSASLDSSAGSGKVNVVDLQTRAVRTLGSGGFPRWSPDGSRIAFSGYADGCDRLVVADADTGEPIFTVPGAEIGFSWSPDGSQIAYSAPDSGPPPGCPASSAP